MTGRTGTNLNEAPYTCEIRRYANAAAVFRGARAIIAVPDPPGRDLILPLSKNRSRLRLRLLLRLRPSSGGRFSALSTPPPACSPHQANVGLRCIIYFYVCFCCCFSIHNGCHCCLFVIYKCLLGRLSMYDIRFVRIRGRWRWCTTTSLRLCPRARQSTFPVFRRFRRLAR